MMEKRGKKNQQRGGSIGPDSAQQQHASRQHLHPSLHLHLPNHAAAAAHQLLPSHNPGHGTRSSAQLTRVLSGGGRSCERSLHLQRHTLSAQAPGTPVLHDRRHPRADDQHTPPPPPPPCNLLPSQGQPLHGTAVGRSAKPTRAALHHRSGARRGAVHASPRWAGRRAHAPPACRAA